MSSSYSFLAAPCGPLPPFSGGLRRAGRWGVNRLLEAALGYIQLGYKILPLTPREKRPHPRLAPNGFKNATLDPKQITAWWRACPRCGIGLALPAGTVALDFDGGQEALDAFLKEFPELRRAPLQRSARRGYHLVLRVPPGVSLPGRVERWGGVDLKQGAKGYLVVAPSEVGGGRYEWITPLPALEALPEAPPKLLDLLTPPPPPPQEVGLGASRPSASPGRLRALLDYHAAKIASTPEGSRHLELLRRALVVGGLLGAGLSREEAERVLLDAALRSGLPMAEAKGVLAWGLSRGEARPLPLEEPGGFWNTPGFWNRGVYQNFSPSLSQKPGFGTREVKSEGERGKPTLSFRPRLGGWS